MVFAVYFNDFNLYPKGLIMGLYDYQDCKDIINEKSPWEVIKGPNKEVAISSQYAVFYRNGSLDEIQATNSFGDRESVTELFPPCHWIFNIPEGIKFHEIFLLVYEN